MEKQVRQATQRFPAAPVRSSSVADTRMLAVSESRRAINEAAGGPEETVPVALSPSGDVPLPQFDALEVLGPSLSDVLTFVNPPMPRSLQEEQLQQQAAGEDTQGESNLTVPEAAETPAKFDVCLSRSVVLGKVVDASVDNSRRTQEYFAKLLDKLQLDATGLVLLQESTVVVFLETTAEQFLEILKQLQRQRILDAASMRILASSDDHTERVLQGLYFKKVAAVGRPGSDNNAELGDDSLRQCVVDTFLDLMKFVKKIGPMGPAEIRKCLTNLSMTDQMCLPSNETVLWLLSREELMAIDEFLDVFAAPVFVELESERVWPVHPLIQY
jgi:predicted RNA binding protein with dsRBD fold (UPF0201 family)